MSRETQEPLPTIPSFIRRVMPEASEAELEEATENSKEYMIVVLGIYRRLKSEGTYEQVMDSWRAKCAAEAHSPVYHQ